MLRTATGSSMYVYTQSKSSVTNQIRCMHEFVVYTYNKYPIRPRKIPLLKYSIEFFHRKLCRISIKFSNHTLSTEHPVEFLWNSIELVYRNSIEYSVQTLQRFYRISCRGSIELLQHILQKLCRVRSESSIEFLQSSYRAIVQSCIEILMNRVSSLIDFLQSFLQSF